LETGKKYPISAIYPSSSTSLPLVVVCDGCVRIVVVPILVVEILWGYHLEFRINNDEEGTCIVHCTYDAPAEKRRQSMQLRPAMLVQHERKTAKNE